MNGNHATAFDFTSPERYRASRRVTWTSVGLNLVLTAVQITVGIVGNSQALVADGVHTLSDLITDGMVLFAIQHSAKGADEEHPYGHARIETAVTLVLGIMLVVVAMGIAWRAGDRMLLDAGPFTIPSIITLWIALLTLAVKEGLYIYTMRTAARFGSELLRANAWHHRSDAISSLIVVAGIGGAQFGFGYLDAVAAIVVAVFVAKIGVQLGWRALRELIDTGLDPDDRDEIRRVIHSVNGVKALHLLRTRRMGGQAYVDVHILVEPKLSVSEGHQISEVVRQRLIQQIAPVTDVMVHIDTEEDEAGGVDSGLPLRAEIENRLQRYFTDIPQAIAIEETLLHYGKGQVDVELRLPLSAVATTYEAQALGRRFANAARSDKDIGKIDVYFH
ncbi:MAG TPA: cation diffusion facilitator family transporter [Burkholderiales bacterium]